MFNRDKLTNWFFLIFTLLLFLNVIRSYFAFQNRRSIVSQVQIKLQKTKEENENLKRQLARVESKEYIEEEARNKLNMGREGEMILILPSVSPITEPTPIPIDTTSNPEKWLRIFFKG